ncbi:MAG: phospho-N-acetylmuramoyl-pentapeptide-transferase [Chloroflexi bacterium]|nr:phospho-N-acetylmuramoyl-pentapeptide-transferase [Chloroflexota bacterium]
MTLALLFGAITFLALLPLGRPLIHWLTQRGIGKHIRVDGPAQHQVKSGTPTMGGIYFVGGAVIGSLAAAALGHEETLLPVIAVAAFAALGAIDDWKGLRDASGVGWLARYKFPVQWGTALIVALLLYWLTPEHLLVIPGTGKSIELGWWAVVIATPLLVFISNAVNISDGQDGLAGGMSALAYAAFGLVALMRGNAGLTIFSFVMVGSLCAFLWYNAHPASVFMGDIGSEALGAGLVALAMLTGQWIVLLVIALVFIVEALSVMLQVSYFKYTKRRYGEGRRILKMSPLHHHFELLGIPEERITVRFWLAAAVCCALGVALAAWGA